MSNSAKLRFLGIWKLAKSLKEILDFETVATELGVSPKDLTKWDKEFRKSESLEEIQALLDVDAEIVEQIASDVASKATKAAAEPRVEIVGGKIVVKTESDEDLVKQQEAQDALVEQFKCKVNGLQALNAEVQGTAGLLLKKITHHVNAGDLDIKELTQLTTALTSIQNAFFNRPTTQIMVNTGGSGDNLLGAFKARMRS